MSEWKEYKLEEVVQLIKDSYKPNENDNLAYLGLEHFNEQSLTLNSIGSSQDITSNKFYFQENDILFGKLR
ncbi:MAG TPA: hypothetical protein V6C58_23540, partial [Allocoleopsis sp.]